jgi:pilus assembly protein CpaB
MKPKTIIPLVIGLAVGFLAIKMGLDMVQKARGAQGGEMQVLVSAKQIEVATKITDTMLGTKRVASTLAPPDAFTASKELIGRVTSMTIAPGVPITTSMLAPPGTEPGLRALIPPGMRAVSVSVTEETAVAGFILPGSRVDVSAVPKYQGPAKLILSDVEVGAVGQSMSRVSEDGKTVRMEKSVTLFLRPEEVQILHAYGGVGGIRLALRGVNRDPEESAWSKLAKGLLASRAMPSPKPTQVASAPHIVDLVRGAEFQKLVFDSKGNMRRFSGDSPIPFGPGGSLPTPNPQNTEVHE